MHVLQGGSSACAQNNESADEKRLTWTVLCYYTASYVGMFCANTAAKVGRSRSGCDKGTYWHRTTPALPKVGYGLFRASIQELITGFNSVFFKPAGLERDDFQWPDMQFDRYMTRSKQISYSRGLAPPELFKRSASVTIALNIACRRLADLKHIELDESENILMR